MNAKVDQYLMDGCGRCDKYLTPNCNVHVWAKELNQLRTIVLNTDLKEELKWSNPCYTYKGKNVAMISAFNKSACLSFFKGALLKDNSGLLQFPGENSRASKRILFTKESEIVKNEALIYNLIEQAIEIEKQGKQIPTVEVDAPYPDELLSFFKEDKKLEKAFNALTPGRQRSYILHFNQAKQSQTKINRIEKSIPKILKGIGFNEYEK
jgi:uncharacterized protein YdeI (YjbR/CyaY-like superfamily)